MGKKMWLEGSTRISCEVFSTLPLVDLDKIIRKACHGDGNFFENSPAVAQNSESPNVASLTPG